MLYQLKTGWVSGYQEGQEPLIYLVSTVQEIVAHGANFVFSDGHGIAAYTSWFDRLEDLDKVDWEAVNLTRWNAVQGDMDRQRRKQAEFLVHQRLEWGRILEIGVLNEVAKARVEGVFRGFPRALRRRIILRPEWYYL
jgi:hypothetical protein